MANLKCVYAVIFSPLFGTRISIIFSHGQSTFPSRFCYRKAIIAANHNVNHTNHTVNVIFSFISFKIYKTSSHISVMFNAPMEKSS